MANANKVIEPHEVVSLLLKRMESNPDEFLTTARWGLVLNQVTQNCSSEELGLISEAQKKMKMDDALNKALAVLLPSEDIDEEGYATKTYQAKMQQQTAQSQLARALQQQQTGTILGLLGQSGLGQYAQTTGAGHLIPLYSDATNAANTAYGTYTTSGIPETAINIGGESLTGSMLKTIKRMCGL